MTDQSPSVPSGSSQSKPEPTVDARVIDVAIRLGVLGVFAYFSLQLVAPFFAFLLWAVVLTVALYPAYAWLTDKLGGRKVLSATILTLIGLGIVIGPVAVLVVSLVETLQRLYEGVTSGAIAVPPLPPKLAELPMVGEKLPNSGSSRAGAWSSFSQRLARWWRRPVPRSCRFWHP